MTAQPPPRELVLAADIGTSACKAALYDRDGRAIAGTSRPYVTSFPAPGLHEQRPDDWWDSFRECVRDLIEGVRGRGSSIRAIAISGQSLALVPLDARDRSLLELVPIWSDARATAEADAFFERTPADGWYHRTGNGFPPHLYTVFKAMWLRTHRPDVYRSTRMILGSKDYINLRLTGRRVTDPSYASGSGVYELESHRYDASLLDASEVAPTMWPPIAPSSDVIGHVLPDVAAALGLGDGVAVVAGGVDNACMALGARASVAGRLFCALGSSNWITVASERPVLDETSRPYVFDHVVPGLYVSAESTFGGGSSLEWARRELLGGMSIEELTVAAERSQAGARGLLCVPILAGGTVAEGGSDVRGALVGIDLSHSSADVARAFLDGVALALAPALERMRTHAAPDVEILVVGGGSRSPTWRRILASVFRRPVVTTDVDDQATTLGAAALALIGLGAWGDHGEVEKAHGHIERTLPDPTEVAVYEDLIRTYAAVLASQAGLAGRLAAIRVTRSRSTDKEEHER